MSLAVGPLTPAWKVATDTQASFLSTRGPVYEAAGGLSAHGVVRPALCQPGKPDGEVAT